MGLDKPITVQYFYWIKDVVKGDFGVSLMNGVDALKIVSGRIPASFELIFISILIAIFLAIIMGVVSGVNQGSVSDQIISSISIGLVSIPTFWVAQDG